MNKRTRNGGRIGVRAGSKQENRSANAEAVVDP
jgi:hypothetical protein